MDSFQLDENSNLVSIIFLSPNYKGSSILYMASVQKKKYDNDLKNVGIQIAFNNT